MKEFNKKIIYSLIGILGFLLLWQIVAIVVNEPIILPGPIDSFSATLGLISQGELYGALISTGTRALIGFLIALLLGGALGTLAYLYKGVRYGLSPLITALRSVPTMSIILVAIIWLSPGVSPVLIGFLIIFPTLYETTYSALLGIDPKLIEMSKVYKISNAKMIKSLYLPSIRKSVLSGARSAISLNVKVVIAGEVLAYTAGSIGMQMYIAQLSIATATLFGWTVYAVLLSFLFELLIIGIDALTDPVRRRNRKRKKLEII